MTMTIETGLLMLIPVFTVLRWVDGSPWAQLRTRRAKRAWRRLRHQEEG